MTHPLSARCCSSLLLTALLAALPATPAAPAVFQYAHTFEYTSKDKPRQATAFLWLPPQAEQVRGVIVMGQTLMERQFAQDPAIREAAKAQQLAILYFTPGLGAADLPELLNHLATTTGYAELATAPLMFVGHSAGGPAAQRLAAEHADRCFGLVQYRGGAPGGQRPLPPQIPALMMMGQFDEFGGLMRDAEGNEQWERGAQAMTDYRKADPAHLGAIAVEPGAGHFAWSDRNAKYLALWITKAAEAQLPKQPAEAPGVITRIDPATGYLSDMRLKGPQHPAAPYADYTGPKDEAAWHFDKEMAEATAAYHDGLTGRKDQFITWADRYWVDAGARYFFMDIKWVGDGQTFEVHPKYAEAYPSQHNGQGPHWHRSGQPAQNSGAPIKVKKVAGPVEPVGDNRFRWKHNNLTPAGGRERVTFMAYSAGDDEFRYTEQVGMLPRGFKGLTKGADQTLTFPPIDDVTTSTGPIELNAVSSAGLPVSYYVAYGPAQIIDGKLVLKDVPTRAVFPIPVKVVAYQFGSGVDPQVKTAQPAEQTFAITGR